MPMFYGNVAQYGNQIASGITELRSTMGEGNWYNNKKPFHPVITVFVLDFYGNIVRRRNRPTSVIATVRSGMCVSSDCTDIICVDKPDRFELSKCPTVSQGLFGKPVAEIPGLAGTVNFTGLGLRGWPGHHTMRIEIPGISQIYRGVNVYNCKRGEFLHFESGVDGGSCEQCPSGYFKNISGIWPCLECPAGVGCKAGSYVPKKCQPGEMQPEKMQQSCLSCSPGQYSNRTESTKCYSCSAGKFSQESKSTLCQECPAGRSTNGKNSVVCGSCDSGRYAPHNGSLKCFDCEKGWSKNGTANVKCEICLPGFFSENVGAYFCTQCAEGTIAISQGQSNCDPCNAGSFANDSKICSACPSGVRKYFVLHACMF